ncbi:hypothetical protein [Paraburkholderia sp. BCC1886]|uniref:hypothetical protein n=1 Tax=Paraburkholderia sp. BCC1886 TaxID=2562670 RepID=UPI001182C528|nr:hypothetical protein [Paraburkholderia sp. BCC1886]
MTKATQAFVPIARVAKGEASMEDGTYPDAEVQTLDHIEWDWENCPDGMLLFGAFDLPPIETELKVSDADGLKRVDFLDVAERSARLQEASSAMEQHVWLGLDEGRRMLLDRQTVAQLLPHLHKFVATGEL